MSHTCSKKVRGFHCDAYGHVNNARYLEFLEEARWTAFEEDKVVEAFDALGLQFFVVNITIRFKSPVLPETTIDITTSLGETKRKTISFIQEIHVDGNLSTSAEVTFVLFDKNTQRAVMINESHLAYFKNLSDA